MNLKEDLIQKQSQLTTIRASRIKLFENLNRNKKGLYTIYRNNVYQINDFKSIHPGGKIIELALNKDCTELVQCYHSDNVMSKVQKIMEKHHVMSLEKNQQLPQYDNSFMVAVKRNVESKIQKLKLNKHSYQFIAVLEVVLTLFLYFYFTYKVCEKNQFYYMIIYGILLGILTARLGFMMHMGSHRAISKNPIINSLVEYCMDIIGGSSISWRSQHVYAHHTAPNEKQTDGDCSIGQPLIRLHPQTKWKWYHTYQAPLVISAMSIGTMKWAISDIIQFIQSNNFKNDQKAIYPTKQNWAELIFFKTTFLILHIILPAYNNGFLLPMISCLILFVVSAHYMQEIFIINHIQSGLVPRKNVHWAVKQIEGTSDWSSGSKIANFLSGGLNHQVIHHLFPGTSHWIYPELVPIVKQTCEQFGLKYQTYSSFWSAWLNMFNYLADLGMNKRIS